MLHAIRIAIHPMVGPAIRRLLLVGAALTVAACGEHGPESALQPNRRTSTQLPPDRAALEGQINTLINALYAPTAQGAVFASLARIRAALASGRKTEAQAAVVAFFRATLADFDAGTLQDPNGAQPPTLVDALRDLLNDVALFGGLPAPIPENNPFAGDGAVGVIGSSGGTLVSSSGFGGVSFPAGALPSDVIVVISRLPNPTQPGAGPLPTGLDQYPLFYDFSTTPVVAHFAQPVTVGICRLEVGEPFAPATQAIADRLLLAHPDPANPATVELLPAVSAAFVNCGGVSLSSADRQGDSRRGVFARALAAVTNLGSRVVGLLQPTPAYAVHGGLGGLTSSFSPFAAVDPGGGPYEAVTVRTDARPSALGPIVNNIADAITRLVPGGRITVFPGTYLTRNVQITKPLSLEPASSIRPVLDGSGAFAVLHAQNLSSGSVDIQGMEFRGAGGHDVVVEGPTGGFHVANSAFYPPAQSIYEPANPDFASGVSVWFTSGGQVVIENNTFVGGAVGVHGAGAQNLVVRANSFRGQSNRAVQVGGTTGKALITGNTATDCPPLVCIAFYDGDATVTNNQVTVDISHPVQSAIGGGGIKSVVTGNVITGTGGAADPGNPSTWPIPGGAIGFYHAQDASAVGNRITRAYLGIWYDQSTGSGTDNVIDHVHTPVGAWAVDGVNVLTPSVVSFLRNDMTNYTDPLPPWIMQGISSSNFTCNWWGSAGGPTGVAQSIPPTLYTPWATAPIANGTGCATYVGTVPVSGTVTFSLNGSSCTWSAYLADIKFTINVNGRPGESPTFDVTSAASTATQHESYVSAPLCGTPFTSTPQNHVFTGRSTVSGSAFQIALSSLPGNLPGTTLSFAGAVNQSGSQISGVLTWQRIDQTPESGLNWTLSVPITLSRQ